MKRVLIDTRERETQQRRSAVPGAFWEPAIALGLTLAVVALGDLFLLWMPLRFGTPEWEFGTVSAHFEGMSLVAVAFGVLGVGVLGRGWRTGVLTVAGAALLLSLFLVGAYLLYLLNVPIALRGVAEGVRGALVKAVVKTSLLAATFTAFHAWLGVYLWRQGRATE